jgi:hypothetical protein
MPRYHVELDPPLLVCEVEAKNEDYAMEIAYRDWIESGRIEEGTWSVELVELAGDEDD